MKGKKKTAKNVVARKVCDWISGLGVSHVFMVSGSQIDPIAEEVANHTSLNPIVACHELGAGFMADGFARASLGTGVSITIGGPGALYVLPSSVVSRVDHIPVLFLTGDSPTWLNKSFTFQNTAHHGSRDRELFNAGIDDTQTVSEPSKLAEIIHHSTRRLKGQYPAHIVIPYDVQKATVEYFKKSTETSSNLSNQDKVFAIGKKVISLLKKAKYPVVLVGRRLYTNDSTASLKKFINISQLPFATSYDAKGIIPEDHPLSLGNFGFAGTTKAYNTILGSTCDLLLVLGHNFGQRDTGYWDRRLYADKRVILIDEIEFKMSLERVTDLAFRVGSISDLLHYITGEIENEPLSMQWSEQGNVQAADLSIPDTLLTTDWVVSVTRSETPKNTMLFVDAGSHKVAAGIFWKAQKSNSFFSSETLAPMGWAICAAIGAKLARPHDCAIVLTGDGCMRMHGMEIATAVRYRVKIVFVIINNRGYASIAPRMNTLKSRKQLAELPEIYWSKFAESVGAKGFAVGSCQTYRKALKKALQLPLPSVIQVNISFKDSTTKHLTVPGKVWPDKDDIDHNSSL